MKKIYVIHGTHFDFERELYAPLKKLREFEFVFPHEKENETKNSKFLISECDLVLAEVSSPSTGSGIELGRAECAGIPIVLIFKKESQPSSSIKFLTADIIEYESLENDLGIIEKYIKDKLK